MAESAVRVRGRVWKELERYRLEIGAESWTELGRNLKVSAQTLSGIAERGYATPPVARRIEKRTKGRLPAWLLLGLDGPPLPQKEAPKAAGA